MEYFSELQYKISFYFTQYNMHEHKKYNLYPLSFLFKFLVYHICMKLLKPKGSSRWSSHKGCQLKPYLPPSPPRLVSAIFHRLCHWTLLIGLLSSTKSNVADAVFRHRSFPQWNIDISTPLPSYLTFKENVKTFRGNVLTLEFSNFIGYL